MTIKTQAGRDLLGWRGNHATWTEQRWVAAIEAIEAETIQAVVQAAIDRDDRNWFHAAHGLHDDQHHQHHRPMDICVPLILITNDLLAGKL